VKQKKVKITSDDLNCPNCLSIDIEFLGEAYFNISTIWMPYKCNVCDAMFAIHKTEFPRR